MSVSIWKVLASLHGLARKRKKSALKKLQSYPTKTGSFKGILNYGMLKYWYFTLVVKKRAVLQDLPTKWPRWSRLFSKRKIKNVFCKLQGIKLRERKLAEFRYKSSSTPWITRMTITNFGNNTPRFVSRESMKVSKNRKDNGTGRVQLGEHFI